MIPEPEEPEDSCSDNEPVWDGYPDDDIEPPESPTKVDDPPKSGSSG